MTTFGRIFRIELLKSRKRIALWVTAGGFSFIMAMLVLVPLVLALSGQGGAPFAFPLVWRGALGFPINVGGLFLGVLTIQLAAREFGWKTARQNVIDGFSREQFYFAKVLVLGLLTVLFLIIPIVLTTAGVVISPDEGTGTFAEATDLNYMLAYLLVLTLWGSAGLMLAMLIRAAGGASGVLLLYFIVENIVVSLLTFWREELDRYLGFLPVQITQALARQELHYPDVLAATNARRQEFGQPPLELPDFGGLVVATLAWAALFLTIAFVSTRRRDL